MATIQIVSNLKLHPQKGLLSKDGTGKWINAHYQQGDLDGACAVLFRYNESAHFGYD